MLNATSAAATLDTKAARKGRTEPTLETEVSLSPDGRVALIAFRGNVRFRSFRVLRSTVGVENSEVELYAGVDLPFTGVLPATLSEDEYNGKVNCSYRVEATQPIFEVL
jgi:hypothetical protein